jgi:riboflavin synthase alpha subunit
MVNHLYTGIDIMSEKSEDIQIGDKVLFDGQTLTVIGMDSRFLCWEFEEKKYTPIEYSRLPSPKKI